MNHILRSQGGFTMIEMATIIVMIGILAMIAFANTQTGNRHQQLRDAAADYVGAVKRAESMASGSEAVADPSGQKTSRKAYGVCITSSEIADSHCASPGSHQADSYQIYARTLSDTGSDPGSSLLDPPDQPSIIESHRLPSDYTFTAADVWVDYVPPAPSMFANGRTSAEDVVIRYQDLDANQCVVNKDCRSIQIRPLAGAAYVVQ